MDNKHANTSIECTVTSCAHHCADKQYCSLSAIKVGHHERCVTTPDATECASFALGDQGCGCN